MGRKQKILYYGLTLSSPNLLTENKKIEHLGLKMVQNGTKCFTITSQHGSVYCEKQLEVFLMILP